MATVITTTFLLNGSKDFTAVIQIDGTTAAGEVTAQPVIDPKAIIAGVQAAAGLSGLPNTFKIDRIDWSLTGFAAQLSWDATIPVLAAAISQYGTTLEFREAGHPLTNNAGTGITGKLTLTTKGLAAGMWGTIIIKGFH